MNEFVVGSRGSRLALWQAHHLVRRLSSLHPHLPVRIEVIKTSGDKLTDVALAKIGGKGVFVKEIEEALLEGRIHLAVHSLKDVPTELPKGLCLSTILSREDPRDGLVSGHTVSSIADFPAGAILGTGSLRRSVQLRRLRSDLEVQPIRGNVETRLQKVSHGLDGVILAVAGLKRLQRMERLRYLFPVEEMTPAVGQGALAVETREDDSETRRLLSPLEDSSARQCVEAERHFLLRMGGGCQVPMGAHAWFERQTAFFTAFVAGPSSLRLARHTEQGEPQQLIAMAELTLSHLLDAGAADMLKELGGEA